MDDDFVYLYIDSSQKLKIYILDNLESQVSRKGPGRLCPQTSRRPPRLYRPPAVERPLYPLTQDPVGPLSRVVLRRWVLPEVPVLDQPHHR